MINKDFIDKIIEKDDFDSIQSLRSSFSPELFNKVSLNSISDIIPRGKLIIKTVLDALEESNIDFSNSDPGHALGHFARDYAHSIILTERLSDKIDPKQMFIGFVAGTLHDIGCVLVDRYAENKRVVRHAEVGALLLKHIFDNYHIDLNESEKILIPYAVSAHTHYLKSASVKCKDGIKREILPYQDLNESDQPLFGIWLPRWIDRLDCNGPAFVGRCYLTSAESHYDFDGKSFFSVNFLSYMTPTIEIAKEFSDKNSGTLLSQLNSFASTQNNYSPYGKHDFGIMSELRDSYKQMLLNIINSVREPVLEIHNENEITKLWTTFLSKNIEPTFRGEIIANKLDNLFNSLDRITRNAWCNGFISTMQNYQKWSQLILSKLDSSHKKIKIQDKTLGEIITPHPEWANKLISLS